MSEDEATRRRRLRLMQMQAQARMQQPAPGDAPRTRPQWTPEAFAASEAARSPESLAMDAQSTAAILEAQQQPPQMGRGRAALHGATQGATLGWGDEILGAVGGVAGAVQGAMPGGQGIVAGAQEGYTGMRDAVRQDLARAREQFPGTVLGAEIAGAMAVPVGAGAVVQGASLPARMGHSAGVGARMGAVYGAGASEADSAGGVARDAAIGGLVGGAAGAVIPAAQEQIARSLQRLGFRRAVRQAGRTGPSTDELRGQSSALYESARARGVEVRADNFDDFAARLTARLYDEGVDPDITPRAAAALRRVARVQEGGQNVSLRDLELMRRVAGRAAASPDPNEQRLAGIITEQLDDYMLRLADGDLAAGSAAGLSDELRQARELWRRMRNSEAVELAVQRARDQGSGFENGIRIAFRSMLRDRRAAQFMSEGEREALRQVVRGTPVGNFLRVIAGLGGGLGAQRNLMTGIMGAGIGGSAGAAVGGPVGAAIGAAAPVAAGQLAARGSEALTLRGAAMARNVMAGGAPIVPGLPEPNALARLLMPRGAVGAVPVFGPMISRQFSE